MSNEIVFFRVCFRYPVFANCRDRIQDKDIETNPFFSQHSFKVGRLPTMTLVSVWELFDRFIVLSPAVYTYLLIQFNCFGGVCTL